MGNKVTETLNQAKIHSAAEFKNRSITVVLPHEYPNNLTPFILSLEAQKIQEALKGLRQGEVDEVHIMRRTYDDADD